METLGQTSPDVKRYQRQKLRAMVAATLIALVWLALCAFWIGPILGNWLSQTLGDHPWLRLWCVAAFLGLTLELLTLPIDFYSGFILEHRYDLSNQTLGRWIFQRLKGYAIGGVLGLLLLTGLYALL